MKKYVIIGNGVAAIGCIEGIRSADTQGEITVISEEEHETYCRPLISYYLENKTDLTRMLYRGPDHREKMQYNVLYGKKAVRIADDEHCVELDDGTRLPYSALCAATGSSPFVPPITGLEKVKDRYTFITLDDALGLEKAISADSRVLILGAGLIGLKCAEGIIGRVKSVTVCDMADHILPSIFDKECGDMMQKHLEKHGVSFILNDSAESFEADSVRLKSGGTVDFDVLVTAVGVRPNVSLLKDVGARVNRGIVTDEHMRTSVEDIYAAGDCTEGYDVSSGECRVIAVLPNAYMQGYTAGVNMAGGAEVFDKGMPLNSIGFFGLHAMTAGSYDGEVYETKTENSIKRLYIKDGLLKGFMLLGCDERAGIYTALIREKTPLSSVDLEILKNKATTAAFLPEKRRKIFGGTV